MPRPRLEPKVKARVLPRTRAARTLREAPLQRTIPLVPLRYRQGVLS